MQRLFGGFFFALLLCFPAHAAWAQDKDTAHEVSPPATVNGGTSPEAFARRVESEALDYQKKYPGGSVARTVDFDSAFPKDAAEFAQMDKYAVMLVSAVTHDPNEFPVKVYVTLNGKSANLREIARMRRDVPPGSSAYAEFGPYREDVFMLVPALLLFTEAEFMVDFAAHRSGFEFGKGPLHAPGYLAADHSLITVPATNGPPLEVVKMLIAREYPGFWPN